MKQAGFHSQSGKSVLEMIIVVTVAAILTSMAVMRIGTAQVDLQRKNLAREFKVNLERARFDSVKRRATEMAEMSRITLTSANTYTVLTDFNQNGRLDTAELRTITFITPSNIRVIGTNLVFPVTITFDRMGNARAVNAENAAVTPTFTFCEGECTLATANVSNSDIVALSASGTVAMMAGGETVPTFNNPNVTTVGSGSGVNEWMTIRGDNYSPTPTPSPNATPVGSTPTPTPTPDDSPTPTPTATPTPTPTPNILYCTSGQRPSATGCVCKLPMTVRANGKCQ